MMLFGAAAVIATGAWWTAGTWRDFTDMREGYHTLVSIEKTVEIHTAAIAKLQETADRIEGKVSSRRGSSTYDKAR